MLFRRALLVLVLLLAFPSALWATVTDEYFGIYLPKGKAGFMHIAKNTAATYAKKKAVRTENVSRIAIRVLGSNATTVSRTVLYSDPKTGAPLFMTTRTEAAGRVSFVSAIYSPRAVAFVADIQGTKKTGTLALAPGESFLVDPNSGASGGDTPPKVGQVLRGKMFVPETLRLADETITVTGRETVTVAGKPVETFAVVDTSELGTVTFYVTAKGETVLFRFPLGMVARRESKTVALRVPTDDEIAGQGDLAVAVGIVPTGVPIDDMTRAAPTIRYGLRGATGDFPPQDNRQAVAVTGTGSDRVATVTVTATPLPESSGTTRFAKPGDAPETVRPFLLPSDYVSSGDAIFTKLAADATQGETDIAKASAKIAAFVHAAITPDAGIAALRTASDIEKDRRGVCREYTTFFAAIARSAGIPTRVCVGVVWADGAFVYHAWPEVWVGDAGWIALEPTWGKPFADATHIKLAQGEITDLYRVSGDMGRYRLEVLP